MSIISDKLALVIPDRGEFPGEWDLPLNDNLEKIDLILWKAYTNNPALTQPDPSELVGSPWYQYATKVLYLKGQDGVYHAAAKHIHDGSILDIPKVMLTNGRDVQGVLPGYMVGSAGLDAEKLGGRFAAQYVTIQGTGLTIYTDPASGLGAIKLEEIGGFGPSNVFNKVTVDNSGRVVAGELKTTLSGLGIVDGLTSTDADATYAKKTDLTTTTGNLETAIHDWTALNYAAINGNSSNAFAVLTSGAAADAVSVSWAGTNLAARNGNAGSVFAVADSTAATSQAVPRSQADLLYAAFGHNHTGTYISATGGSTMTGTTTMDATAIFNINGTLNISTLINANGGMTLPLNKWVTVASNPTLDGHLTRKKYVDDKFLSDTLTPAQIASAYAAKNGAAANTFDAADALNPTHVINMRTGDVRYATSGNLSSLESSINAAMSNLDNVYIKIEGSPKVSSGRMGIMRSRLTAGVPDVLHSNPDKSVDLFASADEPCIVAVPGGVTQYGTATYIVYAPAEITDIFEQLETKVDATYATKADLDLDSARWVSEGIYKVTADESHAGATYIYTRNRLNDAWASEVAGSTVAGTPLPNNATLYAMLRVRPIDFAQGVEYTAIAPTYSYDAPVAPADKQFWFNLNEECFYRYYTAETKWERYPAAMMATVQTDGTGTPTSIVMYDSKLTYDFKVPTPTMNMQVPNKKYVDDQDLTRAALAGSSTQDFNAQDLTVSSEVIGPKFKITPEGGYAIKLVNLSGGASVKGTVLQAVHATITEAGDTGNQLSAWEFFGQTISNTDLGTVYWNLTYTGGNTTIDIYKDSVKTQLVATGTMTGTGGGVQALAAANASGLTGNVTILAGARTTDNDAGNTLFIGVDNAVNAEEAGETMPIGIAYENGVANGAEMWVVVSGIADVLLDDTTTNAPVTRGGVLIVSPTNAGRADFYPNPTGLTTGEHFREVGHTLQGVPAGTNRLVRAVLHWN